MDIFMITITIINIVVIFFSPIVANIISIKLNQRSERLNEKLKILRVLMVTRMNRACIDYANALNLIDVVFYNSKNVRNAYKELLDMYYKGNVSDSEFNTKNLKLIEEIIKDVGYSNAINWDEISLPYSPQWYLNELEKNKETSSLTSMIKEALIVFLQNQKSEKQDSK